MKIRKLEPSDYERLRQINDLAGYGCGEPKPEDAEVAYVVEDAGKIIGMAGAEKCAHIYALIDPTWGSPARRLEMVMALHKPVAEELIGKGFKHAYAFVQSKRFGQRLMKLGWLQHLYVCFSMSAEHVKPLLKGGS